MTLEKGNLSALVRENWEGLGWGWGLGYGLGMYYIYIDKIKIILY